MVCSNYASLALAALLGLAPVVAGQTFQRLGACPKLGCIFPPDQQDFLAGQYFDIRLEVHAPANGSEATNGKPDEKFDFTVGKLGQKAQSAEDLFKVPSPKLEKWNFTWYEDLFAEDAQRPSLVNVAAKAYRRVALYEPGEYVATLSYNGTTTVAQWTVRDIAQVRKTKNVLLFIGDGMTTNMITAGRLIAHKSVNGRYQSLMAMDKFPTLGHQMTHSLDSFITDSANSATALYTGHKSTVNALGVYADSSKDPFDDPKVETIAEIFHRLTGGLVGIVSTAFLADATPAALTAHTRDRGQYGAVIDSFIHGIVNYTWTGWSGPDVLMGGGAENFCNVAGVGKSYFNQSYPDVFKKAGFQLAYNKTQLDQANPASKILGLFSTSNMDKWLDRNVYVNNTLGNRNSPDCRKQNATAQPGLRDMTLKAIDTLHTRNQANGDKGWFLMSEAASIDKQMHALDYDRALGELLELDDTIKHSIDRLEHHGTLGDTLIIVTADHGHGFDVFGSADTAYISEKKDQRDKRKAIGVYERSGLSQYINTGNLRYSDSFFPSNWDPRYTFAQGVGAFPDHRENYRVHKDGPRLPATNITGFPVDDYFVNPKDNIDGIVINGTLPTDQSQGVHSLTDVPVYAMGPCHELFGSTYSSIDIFYKMAECLGLSRCQDPGNHSSNWAKYGSLPGYRQYNESSPRYAASSEV